MVGICRHSYIRGEFSHEKTYLRQERNKMEDGTPSFSTQLVEFGIFLPCFKSIFYLRGLQLQPAKTFGKYFPLPEKRCYSPQMASVLLLYPFADNGKIALGFSQTAYITSNLSVIA